MPREFRVDVFRLDGPGVDVEERTDGTVVIHNEPHLVGVLAVNHVK